VTKLYNEEVTSRFEVGPSLKDLDGKPSSSTFPTAAPSCPALTCSSGLGMKAERRLIEQRIAMER